MRGLYTFDIRVEDLSPASSHCGITKDAIEREVRFVVGQSKIKLAETAIDASIYVSVTLLNNCVSNYGVQVLAPVKILKSGVEAIPSIWQSGGVRSGGEPRADTLLAVSEDTKEFVNDWNSVNKD